MNTFHAWIELLEVNSQDQLSTEAISKLDEIKIMALSVASDLSTELQTSSKEDRSELFNTMKAHDIPPYPSDLIIHIITKRFTA